MNNKTNWKLPLIIGTGVIAVILLCVFGVQSSQNRAFALEEQIKPATNTIKEYSESFHELYNSWKYVVEQDDVNINIKYMEIDNDKNWVEKQSIGINIACARKLFKEISECIDRGEFTDGY